MNETDVLNVLWLQVNLTLLHIRSVRLDKTFKVGEKFEEFLFFKKIMVWKILFFFLRFQIHEAAAHRHHDDDDESRRSVVCNDGQHLSLHSLVMFLEKLEVVHFALHEAKKASRHKLRRHVLASLEIVIKNVSSCRVFFRRFRKSNGRNFRVTCAFCLPVVVRDAMGCSIFWDRTDSEHHSTIDIGAAETRTVGSSSNGTTHHSRHEQNHHVMRHFVPLPPPLILIVWLVDHPSRLWRHRFLRIYRLNGSSFLIVALSLFSAVQRRPLPI